MMRVGLAIAVCLAGPAAAQPEKAPESVTVTGTHDRQVLEKFVEGFSSENRVTGKIARWEDGVCPLTIGLAPRFAAFVSRRVREVAGQAGAPVNKASGCKPNIHIVFTSAPQALIDNIKKKQPEFLGYYDNNSQRDALAAVTRPIQAWYLTETKDLRGMAEVDNPRGGGSEITIQDPTLPNTFMTIVMPHARGRNVSGSRLGDGTHSAFHNIIIVADPARLTDHEIGTLADYIAFLSLTQLPSLGACQPLSSIVNLLAKDCAAVKGLTDNDGAYLRGLYRMGTDRIIGVQRAQIAHDMQQSLEGK